MSAGRMSGRISGKSIIYFPRLVTMRIKLKSISLISVFLAVFAGSGLCQSPAEDIRAKVDAVVSEAYQSVSSAFPCKLKADGKPKMLSWEGIEKCFYKANGKIDWESLVRKIQEIRDNGRYQTMDLLNAIEPSLSAHALQFDKVFRVKEADALLPLSNSILKSLPENSLMNLPVYDKSGKRVGTFSGGYTFEKMGKFPEANNCIPSFNTRIPTEEFTPHRIDYCWILLEFPGRKRFLNLDSVSTQTSLCRSTSVMRPTE